MLTGDSHLLTFQVNQHNDITVKNFDGFEANKYHTKLILYYIESATIEFIVSETAQRMKKN